MRTKKLLSIILTVLFAASCLNGFCFSGFAAYSDSEGIIQWDFVEYTEKITTTEAGFTESYNGLTIAIANNGDDSISTGGVYWRGGGNPNDGDSQRYILYTPEKDGTLYVTGKLNSSGGRWGIHTALDYAFSADNSTQSTSETTVSMECTAGVNYYIYSKTRSATVKALKYITASASEPTPEPTPIQTQQPSDNEFKDENGDGIYEWDFQKYSSPITNSSGSGVTEEKYEGLVIAIANNGDDSVSKSGVYWRGGTASGESTRYIEITPDKDGTLYATGKCNSSGGRWGITSSKNVGSLADDESSSSSTSESTVKLDCKAGNTYYILPKSKSATINYIKYITSDAVLTSKVTLNNMYGDNMLIQRGKPIYFEGYSENSESAVITLVNDNNSEDVQTREIISLSDSGSWNTTFDAISNYTDTYTLTIKPKTDNPKNQTEDTIIKNIKFGDLYLCGGQSNMWYYLTYYIGLDYTQDEINNCANSDIRILQLPTPSEDKREVNRSQPQNKLSIDAQWREIDSDFVMNKYLPATVYSLAKKLNEETDVPIGILSTAVGGTTIAQWLENTGIDDFNKKKNWYNTRIYPLHNMELSGIFWYQGCSDKDNGAEYYEQKMTTLINDYRYLFGNTELPFYYVQLTRNGIVYPDTINDERQDNTGMRDVRQAQTNTYLNMKNKTNLGFVSTLDIYGEKEYIAGKNKNFSARVNYHTAQKPLIASRLADCALKDIYKKNALKNGAPIYSHGPLYKSHYTRGNALVVEFDANGNLTVMPKEQYMDNHSESVWNEKGINPEELQEFEIAGSDGVYYAAKAVIENNSVVLTSAEVKTPVSVRYCYSAYPECPNLTDESGIPAYAFTAENPNYASWKFSFGKNSREGFTQVKSTDGYSEETGYGFLGISEESAAYAKVIDGYSQDKDSLTSLYEGNEYVKSTDKQRPVRFALKVEPNTYYKVKVTMSANENDADITLTSERRHFVLTNEKVQEGDTLIKEFTVGVHNVKWKNRDSGKPVPTVYTDDMLNIGVIGNNAALNSIEIQQIEKPKTLWIFGDSTVCDAYTSVPYNGFDTASGWGQAAAKYVSDDAAVINLAEGGLAVSETSYFDVGKNDIQSGDIVLMQMGHNENSAAKYKEGLDYYYNAVTKAGATFVLCSPIHRLTSNQDTLPWPKTTVDTVYTPAAREYAQSKNIPYIDLNSLTSDMNTGLGVIKSWYLHTSYWQESASEPIAYNDATHMNDYGADNTCRMLMEELKKFSQADGYVSNNLKTAIMPSDEVMKNNGEDYVMPPYIGNNELFPYPSESDFEYEVELSDEVTENNVLKQIKLKRNVQLSYITVFAAAYDEYGALSDLITKRLEPSAANTTEMVDFKDENHTEGVTIPQNGTAKIFVWNGAFVDGSMNMKPLSKVYEIK